MSAVRSPARTVILASAAIGLVSLAALAADVFVGTPPFNPPQGQQVTIDLLVDVGADALGSYFFEFEYDPAVTQIVSIGGGTTAEFSDPPATNPGSFDTGITPLAAAQGSTTSPSGFVSVATVTLEAVGLPADSSNLDLTVQSLFDVNATALPSTVFPSSLLVALPEVAQSILFSNKVTLAWSVVPNVTAYNAYRGTIPQTGGIVFNHDCLAPNLASPTATDPQNPPAGQGFYYLVATERNGVEGPLGTTSQGQMRPNFLSCSALASSQILTVVRRPSPTSDPSSTQRTLSARETDAVAFALRSDGDVTRDGVLDASDGRAVLEAVVGTRLLDDAAADSADANGDGRVDVADAQLLRQVLAASPGLEARAAPRAGLSVALGSADCSGVDLRAGLNVVRLRCLPDDYSAYDLLGDLGAIASPALVQRFDPVAHRWRTARIESGQLNGEDFPIVEVESYFVQLASPRPGFVAGR